MDPQTERVLVMLVTGGLVAASCGLVGTFLVLRRMALVGDAISHAILPGLVLGFLVSQSRHPLVMFVGASIAGLATVWLIEVVTRARRVHEETSIGIVFPALFALGVLMISQIRFVDLDVDCVYNGRIELTSARPLIIAGADLGPRSLWMLGAVTVLVLAFVVGFYKELKLTTFDPGLAEALGFPPARVHYALMAMVSLTTVAAFESVGAILVVAFLIVPAAAAHLLTDRLWLTLVLAVGLGMLSVVTGYVLASEYVLDSVAAGGMATMAGFWFIVAWLAAPRHGLIATLVRRQRLRKRFARALATAADANACSGSASSP